MVEPTLLSTLDKGVLTLTLNRPAKLNAIDNILAAALLEELQAAANNPEVRVIRLRGNGRAFCAGRDISAPPTERDLELVQGVAVAIVRNPKPVVAAVHGWTVGAGFEWTMDADVVLAADDARFKLPEASIGVFVTGGLVATLPAIAGLSRAKSMMLFGEEFSARQAVEWGLAHRAVPSMNLTRSRWLRANDSQRLIQPSLHTSSACSTLSASTDSTLRLRRNRTRRDAG